MNGEVIATKLLGVVCVCVLGGILVAGLWPFHSPRNQVTWLVGGNGVQFGARGTLISSGKFTPNSKAVHQPASVEVWLQPNYSHVSHTILAFYAPGEPRQFSIHQIGAGFVLQSDLRDENHTPWFYLSNIFRERKLTFITVTASGGHAAIYLDGALAATEPEFPLFGEDFTGDLVVANSPVGSDSWSGSLRGLAFYDQELPPERVAQHFQVWKQTGRPDVTENDRVVALYLFNERAGRIIHNHVSSGTDLYIPGRFHEIHEWFLEPFWKEFKPTWSYVSDLLVNVGGFIPFGFFFSAYFALVRRSKRAALLTILLGFLTSLTIETLQGFLPTRGSGTTDIFTNTAGTCCGVWLDRIVPWRDWLAKISLPG